MSVELESAKRLNALKAKANAATGESSATLSDAVDTLIAGFGQGGGDLPDWDDDSPVIASGEGATQNSVWELTEKGTLRWTMVDPSLTTGNNAIAGFNTTALSVIPLEFQEVALRVKQAMAAEGFKRFEAVYMPYCSRIKIPSTVTAYTMVNGTSIDEIDLTIGDVTSLPDYAYNNQFRLKKAVLPPAITTLPQRSFASNYSLSEINIGNVTVFKNSCFYEAFNLSGTIDFNANLTSIEATAFYRTRLNVLRFHNALDSLPTIASNSFAQARALADIYVPWAEGAVANAPWGASNATIHFNTTYDSNGNPVE